MRKEYDLSKGVRGKFYFPGATFVLPVHAKGANMPKGYTAEKRAENAAKKLAAEGVGQLDLTMKGLTALMLATRSLGFRKTSDKLLEAIGTFADETADGAAERLAAIDAETARGNDQANSVPPKVRTWKRKKAAKRS